VTRRRLILAIVATVLFGMTWWLSLDRLSAEERLLVGTWTFDGKSGTGRNKMYLGSDRRCAFPWFEPHVGSSLAEWWGRWLVRNGSLVFDGEPDAVRRTVRPILRGIGLPHNGAISYGLESIAARELVLVMSDGTRETWTRAPAD
jgi:hypothetical protein